MLYNFYHFRWFGNSDLYLGEGWYSSTNDFFLASSRERWSHRLIKNLVWLYDLQGLDEVGGCSPAHRLVTLFVRIFQ